MNLAKATSSSRARLRDGSRQRERGWHRAWLCRPCKPLRQSAMKIFGTHVYPPWNWRNRAAANAPANSGTQAGNPGGLDGAPALPGGQNAPLPPRVSRFLGFAKGDKLTHDFAAPLRMTEKINQATT